MRRRRSYRLLAVSFQGMSPEEAFKQSSESITGPITKGISKGGILKLYEGLDKAGQDEFKARARTTQPPPGSEGGGRGLF